MDFMLLRDMGLYEYFLSEADPSIKKYIGFYKHMWIPVHVTLKNELSPNYNRSEALGKENPHTTRACQRFKGLVPNSAIL